MSIAPTACIDPNAKIGTNVTIGHYAVIGANVCLEDNVIIAPHVIVEGYTSIGRGTQVMSFACLGGTPQDMSYKGENTQLIIGQNCSIREHVVIHRGTPKDRKITHIDNDCYIMCHTHIGHDCVIGHNTTIGPGTHIGGHCHIAHHVNISGLVAIHHKIRIGQNAMIGGCGCILRDVIPYAMTNKNGEFIGINKVGLQRQGADSKTLKFLLRLAQDFIHSPEPISQLKQKYVASDNVYVAEIGQFLTAPSVRGILRR